MCSTGRLCSEIREILSLLFHGACQLAAVWAAESSGIEIKPSLKDLCLAKQNKF